MMICNKFLKVFRGYGLSRIPYRWNTKQIIYGQEGRLRLLKGCEQVSDAVQVTLGPKGRFVIIDHLLGNPQVTKDGYTVAKAVNLEDRIENLGCSIAKSASERTNWEVGDGTTAAMILTRGIFKEGCRALAGGANPTALKKGILSAADVVIRELASMSTKITPHDELLTKVATVAANGDKDVGNLVAFTLQKIGFSGFINVVRDKKLLETEVEFANGYRIDKGMLSPYFATDSHGKVEFDSPFVLIVDEKIDDLSVLAKFLDHAATNKRPLFILAKAVDPKVLTYLLVNNSAGKCTICVVESDKEEFFGTAEDVEAITNSTAINSELGLSLMNADINCLGSARKIIVYKEYTVIIRAKETSGMLENHIKKLTRLKDDAARSQSSDLFSFYGTRLGKLWGKSAIIHVGAATEVEINEFKDRIDDSVNASQASLLEGVVVGGGAALIHASKALHCIRHAKQLEEKTGIEIIEKACRLPCITIAENAGLSGTTVAEMVYQVKKFQVGFDAYKCEMKDLVKEGIVDATKVVKTSLTNAASVSTMLLTTESVVAFDHEPTIN